MDTLHRIELIRKLANMLKSCPIGETITYTQLSHAAELPIEEYRYLIYRAMKIAAAETGAMFVNERMMGYRRLVGEQYPSIHRAGRGRIRRISKDIYKKTDQMLAFGNDLDNKTRLKLYAEQATFGLLQQMTYRRNMPVVRDEGSPPPPVQETIKASVEAILRTRREAGL